MVAEDDLSSELSYGRYDHGDQKEETEEISVLPLAELPDAATLGVDAVLRI